jgi:hypothetical protein
MESYLIRIYRFDRSKPMPVIGVVEEVRGAGKKTFTNYDELWDILNPAYWEPLKRGTERKKRKTNRPEKT